MPLDYATMNAAVENPIADQEAERTLLHVINRALTSVQRRQIAAELERERTAFARVDSVGHETWYPTKLAVCAAFARLHA